MGTPVTVCHVLVWCDPPGQTSDPIMWGGSHPALGCCLPNSVRSHLTVSVLEKKRFFFHRDAPWQKTILQIGRNESQLAVLQSVSLLHAGEPEHSSAGTAQGPGDAGARPCTSGSTWTWGQSGQHQAQGIHIYLLITPLLLFTTYSKCCALWLG